MDSFFNSLPEHLELIMGFIPTLFMTIVPIAVFVAYKKTKDETKKAQDSAGLLGLKYINVADEMKSEKPNDTFLLGLLSKWSTWAMEGTYNSASVRVEQIVKSKQNRRMSRAGDGGISNPSTTSYRRGVTYTVAFVKPLPFDIKVHSNAKVEFAFIKGHEIDSIPSGDAELDKIAVISGNDTDEIKEWISSDRVKDGLKDLFTSIPLANVSSDGLYFDELNGRPDYENIKNKLDILSGAARKFVTR